MDGKKIGLILEKAVLAIMIVMLAIIGIGTVAIPAVVAVLYAWQWLFIYPTLLIVLVVLAPRKRG